MSMKARWIAGLSGGVWPRSRRRVTALGVGACHRMRCAAEGSAAAAAPADA